MNNQLVTRISTGMTTDLDAQKVRAALAALACVEADVNARQECRCADGYTVSAATVALCLSALALAEE